MTEAPRKPVLIDLEAEHALPSPAEVEPVPDPGPPLPTGQAMQTVARLGARPASVFGRLFRWAFSGLILLALSIAAWDFVTGLLARNPVLGWIATGLVGAVLLALLALCVRELAAFGRLRRLDELQLAAGTIRANGDLTQAKSLVDRLTRLYADRAETKWARDRLAERMNDVFDADTLLDLAEVELLSGLDAAAQEEIETASRQVATVTALVPLALADVVAALTSNLRMIRRIAEIYGGRAGTFGSWRLTRTVLTHLVATGAVAVGDDLIGSIAGGGVLSKISRRFGEGVINGALTARVGVAAMEVCRPMPFVAQKRPSISGLVKRALTGLFST